VSIGFAGIWTNGRRDRKYEIQNTKYEKRMIMRKGELKNNKNEI